MDQDKFSKKIKDRLGDYQSPADFDSWDLIEKTLDTQDSLPLFWDRLFSFSTAIASGIAVVALLLPATMTTTSDTEQETSAATETEQLALQEDKITTAVGKESGRTFDSPNLQKNQTLSPTKPYENLASGTTTSSGVGLKNLSPSSYIAVTSTSQNTFNRDFASSNRNPLFFSLNRKGMDFDYQSVAPVSIDGAPITFAAANNAEGQTDASEKKEKERDEARNFNLYLQFMPTLGYNKVEPNTEDEFVVTRLTENDRLSFKRIGIRVEAGIDLPINDRFQMQAGILYYQRNQRISYEISYADTSIAQTFADGEELRIVPLYEKEEEVADFDVKNIGIHFRLNYVLNRGWLDQYAGFGLEFHKSINNIDNRIKELGFESIPSIYTFMNVYYRAEHRLNSRFSLMLQPTFNYSFYINKDFNAPFYVKPYGFGLNLGVVYKL